MNHNNYDLCDFLPTSLGRGLVVVDVVVVLVDVVVVVVVVVVVIVEVEVVVFVVSVVVVVVVASQSQLAHGQPSGQPSSHGHSFKASSYMAEHSMRHGEYKAQPSKPFSR